MSYTITVNAPASEKPATSVAASYVDTSYYALTKDLTGECQLTNVQSPIGLPEILTYRASNIADIYQNSGIDRTLVTPTKRGISVNYHLRQTWTASDSANPSAPVYAMPVTASLTLRIPQNEFISLDNVNALINKLLGLLYPDGTSSIASNIRFALNPKE